MHTIDLPRRVGSAPNGKSPGTLIRDLAKLGEIHQLWGDSLKFDFYPWYSTQDRLGLVAGRDPGSRRNVFRNRKRRHDRLDREHRSTVLQTRKRQTAAPAQFHCHPEVLDAIRRNDPSITGRELGYPWSDCGT